MSRLAAVGTLWNAARSEPARDGAGESRHADDRGREEGGVVAAETDSADDPVLPAGAVRGHPRADRDQSRGDAVSEASRDARCVRNNVDEPLYYPLVTPRRARGTATA